MFAEGSCPFQGGGNPIDSATCIGCVNFTYGANGLESSSTIRYDCKDINGDDIYAHAVVDTIDIYKMHWHGIGSLLKRVAPGDKRFKVGNRVHDSGLFYIVIEYEGQWYWTLRDEIEIE